MTRSQYEVADDGPRTAGPSEDERYRLLSAERRRTAAAVLGDRPLPMALDDLATAVAEREADDDGAVDAAAVERVAISLHHVHLPKMADAGVIRYDPESTRIE